jgi:hypothetical protein
MRKFWIVILLAILAHPATAQDEVGKVSDGSTVLSILIATEDRRTPGALIFRGQNQEIRYRLWRQSQFRDMNVLLPRVLAYGTQSEASAKHLSEKGEVVVESTVSGDCTLEYIALKDGRAGLRCRQGAKQLTFWLDEGPRSEFEKLREKVAKFFPK